MTGSTAISRPGADGLLAVRKRLPYAVDAVAWKPTGDMQLPQWTEVGRRLGTMGRCSQWWLGDWVRYGVSKWGEKYKVAARITGYDGHSLRNMAYVASRFELSRRRDKLSFSHHAEVSALTSSEQDQWLDLAETRRLSVGDLRVELRAARRGSDRGLGSGGHAGVAPGAIAAVCPECAHTFTVPVV
ncbi:MAG TPA: LmbU family transcriptional regulator [Solirubrobacterales bacterium]|nr:LmbU family transcriptional regulator [Solirubrobacterales bacterium]